MRPSAITQLRDLMPLRPLQRHEAFGVAERQALALLRIAEVDEPAVPEGVISELPRLEVHREPHLAVSGRARWERGRWLIKLRANDALTRQRFSLAHEFKHILDDRFFTVIYSALPEDEAALLAEEVCDHFAACLLMPRPWIKKAWTGGLQDLRALARRFDVSPAAMSVRLSQLGLKAPPSRCAPRHRR